MVFLDSIACRSVAQEVFLLPRTQDIVVENIFSHSTDGIFSEPSVFKVNLLKAGDIVVGSPIEHLAWWFFGILLLTITLFVVFNLIFKNFIGKALLRQVSALPMAARSESKIVVYGIVLFVFSILVALLISIVNREFVMFSESQLIRISVITFIGVFLFMLAKMCFTWFFGVLVGAKECYSLSMDFIYSNFVVISLLMMALLAVLASNISEIVYQSLLCSLGLFVALLYVARLGKFFYVSLINRNGSIVNLFLYLCIVEFIPMFYAFGVVRLLISNDLLIG